MQRAVADKGRAIRLPVYLTEWVKKLHAARAEFISRTGREPEASELADFLGMNVDDVEGALAVPAEPASLDAPVGAGDGVRGGTILAERVADRAGEMPSPVGSAQDLDARAEIHAALLGIVHAALLGIEDERLRLVLVLRYGLDGAEPKTLQEVALEIGTTREYVRRLQRKAHDLLRRESGHLARFLEEAS